MANHHERGSPPKGTPETVDIATATTPQDNRVKPGTQLWHVLQMLRRNVAVCGTTFLDKYLPRYSARIYDLRNRGFLIERARCQRPGHVHKSTQYEYALVLEPGDSDQLFGGWR